MQVSTSSGPRRLDGVQDFRLLVANFVGVERDGRFHGRHGEQLKKMIGNHVAQGAGGFVKAAAMFHAHSFGGGNLHVVDVVTIPERFDNVVGKTKDHQVLDGFFAEIVVDAVDLIFGEDLLEVLVELFGGFQIVAKRFFHDHASPVPVFFFGQAGLPSSLTMGEKNLGATAR